LHVPDEALRLVLRADADAADARVHAVRQREIDDPELAAERQRRLRPPIGQLREAGSSAAGQDEASVFLVSAPVGACAGPRRTSASRRSSSVTLLFHRAAFGCRRVRPLTWR
jgi:hypothetical protein